MALSEAVFSMLEAVLPEYGRFGAVRERTGDLSHNSAPTSAQVGEHTAEVVDQPGLELTRD
ncbi:MAG: hypothetical protein M3Z97_06995 [Candidatus Dormibacteraeota bacterium]|nr:hypothetical protein [Candidatus Dormibacteraeota bacterium]